MGGKPGYILAIKQELRPRTQPKYHDLIRQNEWKGKPSKLFCNNTDLFHELHENYSRFN